MKPVDYSKDYWLKAHGACALCLLTIVSMIVLTPVLWRLGWHLNPGSYLPVCIVGVFISFMGMGTSRYGHSRIPFVLWLIPFFIVGALCLAPVSH